MNGQHIGLGWQEQAGILVQADVLILHSLTIRVVAGG